MRELQRCRACRHKFTPNYRNAGKIDNPQVYCGKPACQRKSRRVSKVRYRTLYAEEPALVAVRMASWRADRRERAAQAQGVGDRGEPTGQSVHHDEGEAPPASAISQVVAVALTGGFLRVSAQIASLIAAETCYGIAESLAIRMATGGAGSSPRTSRAVPVVTGLLESAETGSAS